MEPNQVPEPEISITPIDPDRRGSLLDGTLVAAHLRAEVRAGVETFRERYGRAPGLTAVLVGNDPASEVYVASKTRGCAETGMVGETVRLPADVSEAELLSELDRLNEDDTVDGILVQVPLPDAISVAKVQERVLSVKDVDGFHPTNVGRLWSDRETMVPATPSGIIEMLDRYKVPLRGSHAVVVGRSTIVGKPMAALLLQRHCTVTICHSRTSSLAAVCRQADLLVAAVGRAGLIGPDHIKDGAVVIDVGTNRLTDPAQVARLFAGDERKRRAFEKNGSVLAGDVDFVRARPRTAAITPVPKGVGPLTVAMVLVGTLRCAQRREAERQRRA